MKLGRGRKDDTESVRCECSLLLAKVTAQGLEVKCRRCKRIQVVRVSPDALRGVIPRDKKTRREDSRKQREGG